MANGTITLIQTTTVGAGGTASVVFNSIPQTYDDLKVVASARSTRSGSTVDDLVIRFNGSTTSYSGRRIFSSGSGASTDTLTDIRGFATGSTTTASVFSNNEFYIPNYTSSNNKSVSVDAVNENNATESYSGFINGLWSNVSAITSITMLANNGNLTEFSTFSLYGITRVPAGAKATGGAIYDDTNYWYHVFTSSGVFTPTSNLTCDFLVVAGGGGGGGQYGGGGGAGGYRTSGGTSGRGSAAESALSVTANTNYTITVGAGGAGGNNGGVDGTQGGNSTFSTVTSTGGGRGGTTNSLFGSGGAGGAPGMPDSDRTIAGGGGTSAQGYDSGSSTRSGGGANLFAGAGGGGAGSAGSNNSGRAGGAGGAGSNSVSSWLTATGMGVYGYVAGGGGGASGLYGTNAAIGVGGSGGGGNGAYDNVSVAISATVSTGSGGGGGIYTSGTATQKSGGNGGSGLVIIRYAK